MNHLGGIMQVESAPGQGTRIALIAPIGNGEPEESRESFDEKRRVTQGDIVSNKQLAAVLEKIQADQRKRDEELSVKPRVTVS
jgi:hypothetical protein